jgi:hypothetical protein
LTEQSLALQGDLHDEYLSRGLEVIEVQGMLKTTGLTALSGKDVV